MSKNPLLNALAATGYIILVALLFNFADFVVPEHPNGIAMILAVLSLFVFSAAVMGYIFLSAPLRLFLEGQKQEAVTLFLKTLLAFAATTIVFVGISFLIPFPVLD
jgi:hypothetical protein